MRSAILETTSSRPLAADLEKHRIHSLPVLVLFPHSRCNCRCVMCDIWRIRQVREITAQDLEPHLESLRALHVRWVVFSGGEPLMHSDLAPLVRMLRAEGIRVTLLTAGLLLESKARLVAENVDDVIVSLDGPPEIHDKIRGVPRAFERLRLGVEALRRIRPEIPVSARATVQKANSQCLRATVKTAKQIGFNSISFLAADLTSEAFNRPRGWTAERQAQISPDAEEVQKLEVEIEKLIAEHSEDIARSFIAESPEKLRRIARHFRAHLAQATPVAPPCNAPWVSAVIESDGTVRPCFFHRPYGNIFEKSLVEILNGAEALRFRQELDIPNNPICLKCVCSLHLTKDQLDRL